MTRPWWLTRHRHCYSARSVALATVLRSKALKNLRRSS